MCRGASPVHIPLPFPAFLSGTPPTPEPACLPRPASLGPQTRSNSHCAAVGRASGIRMPGVAVGRHGREFPGSGKLFQRKGAGGESPQETDAAHDVGRANPGVRNIESATTPTFCLMLVYRHTGHINTNSCLIIVTMWQTPFQALHADNQFNSHNSSEVGTI